ncbi:hypothetical protein BPOR_0412g00060 [Botrytis porri]|uniref:Uncharacterized protein n=1 Tax=Botrytis porri TaxID=87229 RepID=A0A4Z1KIX7_9HELO|nr:hypothetical protein BPOR_0412g00060 [Botrytis porri]
MRPLILDSDEKGQVKEVSEIHEIIKLCDIGEGMVQETMAANTVLRGWNGGGDKEVEESGSGAEC